MGRLFRGFAIAAGAGFGVCVGAVLVSSKSPVSRRSPLNRPLTDSELLRLEPILDRLERIEHFVDAAKTVHALPGGTDPRLEQQEAALQALQTSVAGIEKRASAALDSVRNSFEELRHEMPAIVESTVSARVNELEVRLQTDAQESWNRAVSLFESTVEQKISARIGSLEKALFEQSSAITALRTRSEETDQNLQRLIASIDRLVEVAPLLSGAHPQPEPVAEGPRLVKEPEREVRKTRIPMARIFGALAAFGLSRFLH